MRKPGRFACKQGLLDLQYVNATATWLVAGPRQLSDEPSDAMCLAKGVDVSDTPLTRFQFAADPLRKLFAG